jgi:hypothetical protein
MGADLDENVTNTMGYIMIPEKKRDKKYSYTDCLTWSDEERWELINGEAWSMSLASLSDHQRLSRELMGHFWL